MWPRVATFEGRPNQRPLLLLVRQCDPAAINLAAALIPAVHRLCASPHRRGCARTCQNAEHEIADPAATLAVLRAGRKAMIDVLRTVEPMGVAYHGASMDIAAIDMLGETLTGRMEPFAIGGSVRSGRAEAVRARQREVGG